MAAVSPTPAFADVVRQFAFSAGQARKDLQDQLPKRAWTPEDINHLRELLATHQNEALRLAAAEMLGVAQAVESVTDLARALRGDDSRAVRACAAQALGTIGSPEAIPSLAEALRDDEGKVRFAAIPALAALPGGAAALADACAELEGELKARAVTVLGTSGDAAAEPAVREALGSDDDRVALAAARSLRKLAGSRATEALSGVVGDATRSTKLRVRAAAELGELVDVAAVTVLTEALLGDPLAEIRNEAANALARIPDGARKVHEVVAWFKRSTVERGGIDAAQVAAALASTDPSAFPASGSLAAELVHAAVGADPRMTAVLAAMLISSCGNSVTEAGAVINAVQTARGWSSADLEALRIEVGGQTALDPVLSALQADLHTYFQIPIHELNEATRQGWERTIRAAQQGFRARVYMSIAVFCVGIALLAASSVRFLTGDVAGDELWGPGISFVAGLGSMLLVVYTGPLKEIRRSVSDLGSASAAFIAYVHQILEISHTFTSLYMRERMTFEEMEKSSRLIGDAMQATVACLTRDEQQGNS